MATEKQQDELLDHSYDGIQEFDNDLPQWWKMLFYGSIIFAFIYLMWFHVLGIGDSSKVEYMKEMNPNYASFTETEGILNAYHSPFMNREEYLTPRVRAELKKVVDASFEENLLRTMSKADPAQLAKLQGAFPDVYQKFLMGGAPGAGSSGTAAAAIPTITEPLKDAKALAVGKQVFDTQCMTCHGKLGEGGIGPNMTDDYWIHGGKIENLITTVRNGVPAKGMIAWDKTLTPAQIDGVSSYILVKLHGTNPPNAKPPQGDKVQN